MRISTGNWPIFTRIKSGAHKINQFYAIDSVVGPQHSYLKDIGRGDKDIDFVVEKYGANYDCSL